MDEYDEIDEKELEKERNKADNAEAVRIAAGVAADSGNTVASAIGTGVQAASSVTGGKSDEVLGAAVGAANKITPFGQDLTNELVESGAGQKAAQAMAAKKAANGEGDGSELARKPTTDANNPSSKVGQNPNQLNNQQKIGGGQNGSLPSSGEPEEIEAIKRQQQNQQNQQAQLKADQEKAKKEQEDKAEAAANASRGARNTQEDNDGDEVGGMKSPFKFGVGFKMIIAAILPIIIGVIGIILPVVFILAAVTGIFTGFQNFLGIDVFQGNSTGSIDYQVETEEQKEFYNKILDVKNEYVLRGLSVDPLKVIATFEIMKDNGAGWTYETMTKEIIRDIAECMFYNGAYSDSVFKSNLVTYLIPKYLPETSDGKRLAMAEQVFQYIEDYYVLIGKEKTSCTSGGSCNYSIKGFYVDGRNVKKELNIDNLYVRLMQCGTYNGHDAGGTFGQPLEGEELVPFEKYILGVAYQEIGTGVSEDAFKAQLVAARSYILARPTQMGGWHTLKEEDGKWVLQAAACTADQVYCDPDKGCSTVAGGNGQWYQVHSGTSSGNVLKKPLASDSKYRQYAAEVQGEVLVNNQGYVILTDYTDTETQRFISLANSGLDYKQIMMQVYQQKYPSAGISDIYKGNCQSCTQNGEYAKWKQYEGDWVNVTLGNSGKTIKQIGCLVTSLAIQVAKSGTPTNISDFNPGTFVQALSANGAFGDGGALLSYDSVSKIAPGFKYQSYVDVKGMSRDAKFETIKNIVNSQGVYAVAEVKGDTGQHWVAIDRIDGDKIIMMDPGSSATDMWAQYNWANTSRIVYYKVG